MDERKIELAFIGTGSWARSRHLPALRWIREQEYGDYRLNLRGICSLDLEQARQVADEYGFEQVYRDLGELVADERINAIAVLVHPRSLREVLVGLIPRGVPIFSEKPPGASYAEAVELAEQVAVPNLMAFNRRYSRLNNRFKEIVAGMEDLYFAEAHFLRHNRTDEPFALWTGIHIVNLLEYFFGPIAGVRTDRFPNPRNATAVSICRLRFASGLCGLLKIMPCTGSLFERVEAHSNELSAYLHGPLSDDRGRILLHRGGQHGGNQEVILGSEEWVVEQGFVDEYDEFFRVVLDHLEPRSTFQNAVNSMRIAEAIQLGKDIE